MQDHAPTQGFVTGEKSSIEPSAHEHLLWAGKAPGPPTLISTQLPAHTSDCLIPSPHKQGRPSLLHVSCYETQAAKFTLLSHCLTAGL